MGKNMYRTSKKLFVSGGAHSRDTNEEMVEQSLTLTSEKKLRLVIYFPMFS